MQTKVICLTTILIVILIPIAKAEKPYYLTVLTDSNVFNKNDECKLWVFINGGGKITSATISTNIPHKLVKGGHVKAYMPSVFCRNNCCDFDLNEKIWSDYEPRFGYNLVDDNLFKTSCQTKPGIVSSSSFHNTTDDDFITTLNIKFIINNATNSGDYVLKFNFIYQSENNWYIDEQEVKIHVNSIYEQYEFELWVAGFGIAIFSLIIATLSLFKNEIKKFVLNKLKKKPCEEELYC